MAYLTPIITFKTTTVRHPQFTQSVGYCACKHISNPAVASAWQDKHLLQYFMSQQLANRCLSGDSILTVKCCRDKGKPGQRSEARAATQTQTMKCYSWTLVSLQHPPVLRVAVGNLTSPLELEGNSVFAIATPSLWCNLQKRLVGIFKKRWHFFFFAIALLQWSNRIAMFNLCFCKFVLFCVFFF